MSALSFLPASAISLADLTALINKGYQGYVGAFSPESAASYAPFVREQSIDLELSLLARAPDGALAGVVVVGRRGGEGWIGDFALVPGWRGRGEGRRLLGECLDRARAAGVKRLRLEVAPENTAALKLYTSLGFQQTRLLHNFSARLSHVAGPSFANPPAGLIVRELMGHPPLQWLAAPVQPPAWDHALATLLIADSHYILALRANVETGLLCWQKREDEIDLLFFALRAPDDLAPAHALLSAIPALPFTTLRLSYVPDQSALLPTLRSLGFHEDDYDIEMELRFE